MKFNSSSKQFSFMLGTIDFLSMLQIFRNVRLHCVRFFTLDWKHFFYRNKNHTIIFWYSIWSWTTNSRDNLKLLSVHEYEQYLVLPPSKRSKCQGAYIQDVLCRKIPILDVWISLLEKMGFNEFHRLEHKLCFCSENKSTEINLTYIYSL